MVNVHGNSRHPNISACGFVYLDGVAGGQDRHQGGWRDQGRRATSWPREPNAIGVRLPIPDGEVVADDYGGPGVRLDERSVGYPRPIGTMRQGVGALAVQLSVYVSGGRRSAIMGLTPECSKAAVRAVPAFRAGPVPGGEGSSLVEEEQQGTAVGLPLRSSATLKLQSARDPGLVLVIAYDVTTAAPLMQPATIAHPGPSSRRSNDFAERGDAIARGLRSVHRLRSIVSITR